MGIVFEAPASKLDLKRTLPGFRRLLLLVSSLLFANAYALSQNQHIKFRHLTLADGLSQSTVYQILQDKEGFIWLGTADGLNRYDGFTFQTFRSNPADSTSLVDSYARALLEDRKGDIWIGTSNGISVYNKVTGRFSRYQHRAEDSTSLANTVVRALYEDDKGYIWVGGYNGLSKFDPNTGDFKNYYYNPDRLNGLPGNLVWSIIQDKSGTLWVGTSGGLGKFDYDTETFVQYGDNYPQGSGLSNPNVTSVLQDKNGRLWVGTYNGLNLFKPKTNTFEYYGILPDGSSGATSNSIRSIFEDRDGKLWLATGYGLNCFNPETKTFQAYLHDETNKHSLGGNELWSVFQDREGLIWIGTKSAGISITDPKQDRFNHIARTPGKVDSPSGISISGMHEDQQGILWFGTRSKGLNSFNRKTGEFKHYQAGNGYDELPTNGITNVFEDSRNNLWVTTRNYGFYKLNRQTGSFTKYGNRHTESTNRISHGTILDIAEDSKGQLWLATYGGVDQYDPESGQFKHFRNIKGSDYGPQSNSIYALLVDSKDRIWVGTRGAGLSRYDPLEDDWIHFRHYQDDPRSLGHNVVYTIFEDSAGQIWVGGRNGGLNKFNTTTEDFDHYTTLDGLPNNAIYGILEDDHQNLWLSTNQGISKFSPQEKSFQNFESGDGLQSNEFNQGAFFKGLDGVMYFGGINGFNFFHPDSIRPNIHTPPVHITGLSINYQKVELTDKAQGDHYAIDKHISYLDELQLSHHESVFSFEFVALSFISPSKNRYVYKLEGFDDDWIQTASDKRFATYTNLNPGNYTFKVKASNNDGLWNEEGASIQINILPPPWRTWWAYASYGVVVTALLALFYFHQRAKVNTARAVARELREADELKSEFLSRLKREVNSKTAEIKSKNQALTKANNELEIANKELSTLNREKDGMIGVVSHDLRAPFNKIKGLLSLLELDGNLNQKQKSYARLANKVINGGLSFIQDLLDVTAIAQKRVDIKLSKFKLDAFIGEFRETYQSELERKKQRLHVELHSGEEVVETDKQILSRIIDNLLTNAIKFSPIDSDIYLHTSNGAMLSFSIKDEGPGISEPEQKLMFKKFQKLSAQPTGGEASNGLGLSIVKQLTDRLQGEITVDSQPTKGTKVTVSIPKTH